MKKIILSLCMFALTASGVFAEDNRTSYLGVGLGIMAVPDYDGTRSGIGLNLKGGVALDEVLQNLGVELELQNSIIDPELGRSRDVDVLSLGVYGTYDIKIPSTDMALRPRFGIILPNLGDEKSVNTRNYGFSSGLDVTFRISQEMKVYAGYTNLGENINSYLAGIEFHF
ncbi:porin family protein [bacterium]|nr:porin family protein [bacterium]MBU1989613.1 porin family protein [bacterium]